ncbi:hypothetical protein M3Y94_00605400 [Aphelenchoides besseyi]|nr:hypothetical protein M3Y94_00604500 [Aphelenchoides besseyi]KAI6203856.1 hypothetical protein M3Y94_00605400 [Aphelenchoides besseyi]KAI6222256.1 hypothetical protein M3Y95_00965700 [Aphelenchoides besseyi]KAI6222265.1 hypothetical protein M3Y95_00966600 [Aphelenchoides besseyi]
MTCFFVLFLLVAVSTQALVVPPKEVDNKFHLLCKPCKWFFAEVKKLIPDVTNLSKEELEKVIDKACDDLDFIPFLNKICDKLVDEALDKLYDLIVREDKRIDPEHCCQKIRLC